MTTTNSNQILARSFGTIAAIIILASGVTYAALQSQQIKLTGNTIETATANLVISADGSFFANSKTGFSFNNLIPGGGPTPWDGYSLWLKNSGGTPLNLKLAVSSVPTNPNNVDLTKLNVILTPVGNNAGPSQSFTLQSLIDANTTGGLAVTSPSQLFVGNTQQYTIKVSMAIDAISGSTASLGNIDFAFTGQAAIN